MNVILIYVTCNDYIQSASPIFAKMTNCFAGCSCIEGITKSDLDRFTDTIEKVLNDEKGRRHFRIFMYISQLKTGLRVLDFWELNVKLLEYKENVENVSYKSFLGDIDRLIKGSYKIDDIDLAATNRLITARGKENKEEIIEALIFLKMEATKALNGNIKHSEGILYLSKLHRARSAS